MNKRDVIYGLITSGLPDTAEVTMGGFEEAIETIIDGEGGQINLVSALPEGTMESDYVPNPNTFDYIMRRIDDPLFDQVCKSSNEEWEVIKKILLENRFGPHES